MSSNPIFRPRPDCGNREPPIAGRYFAVQSNESNVCGWVSDEEYRWLCERFGLLLTDDEVTRG